MIVICDLFNTVFDIEGSIAAEGNRLFPGYNWKHFARKWIKAYSEHFINGDYANVDKLFVYYGTKILPPETQSLEMLTAMERLKPWPDAEIGLKAIRWPIGMFSNANKAMQYALADELPWTYFISAEDVEAFKPDPAMYQLAIETLVLEDYRGVCNKPSDILLAASHLFDLDAAKEAGMTTAFIDRGSKETAKFQPDYHVNGFDELAKLI